MSKSSPASPLVRFAQFELDSRAGELRKEGRRIRLQEQPLRVLAMLLEHPGELVTREELRQKLWPADTFVDFDHGLNGAVARLRDALNDSAEDPKYIETLARRGYRFIAPVDSPAQPVVAHDAKPNPKQPIVRRLVFAFAVVALSASTIWYFVSGRVESSVRPPRVAPLTSLPDRAESPSFSPDGNYVAFARYSSSPDLSGIYIKQVDGDHLLQLT